MTVYLLDLLDGSKGSYYTGLCVHGGLQHNSRDMPCALSVCVLHSNSYILNIVYLTRKQKLFTDCKI